MIEALLATCTTALTSGKPLVVMLFVAGLVSGFTHCAAMCGPLLLARAAQAQGAALLPYHAGRLMTYALLGGVSAGLSRMILADAVEQTWAALVLGLAGALFIAEGLLGKPVTAGFAHRFLAPLWRRANQVAGAAQQLPPSLGLFVTGLAMGFIPCGMLIAALMAVSAQPGALMGALGMAAFAAGTLPGLVLVSATGRQAARRWPGTLRLVARTALAGSGLQLFILATSVIA